MQRALEAEKIACAPVLRRENGTFRDLRIFLYDESTEFIQGPEYGRGI